MKLLLLDAAANAGAVAAKTAANDFCNETIDVWKFIGYVVMVLKILIPVIIIILGIVDLGKAVIAGKDDEIKKSTTALMMRLIIGIVVFFVPSIVRAVFGLVDAYSEVSSSAEVCINCVTSPGTACPTKK